MDKYGQEIFTIEGKTLTLPRASTCRKVYKNIELLVMSQLSPYNYEVIPHINEKHYTDTESLEKVKNIIWYNFFCHDKDYKFDNLRYYPKRFKIYLECRLGLNIEVKEVDTFIMSVRNSIFDYIVCTASPRLIAGANWIADGVLRMSTTQSYVIKPEWSDQSNFDI